MVQAAAYLMGGASLLSTIIVTVLDGVSYGSSRASTPDSSLIEAIILSLSIISCAMVLALVLICANDSKIGATTRQKGWRASTYGTGIGYFSIATGITAGAIAWSTIRSMEAMVSPHRQSLVIARCVIWAISVLSQGILCGYLLTTLTINDNHNQWPSLIPHEIDTILPSRSGTIRKGAPSSIAESQRRSIDTTPHHQSSVSSTTSRRSTRYSGRTLIQPEPKPNSLDLNPTLIPHPENVAIRSRSDGSQGNHDSETNPSRPQHQQQLQRSNSEIKRSLDSVMLRPSSIPSSSTPLDVAKRPLPLPKLKLPDESNIHPLFRSDSRSPPPNPTPGTMVLASPEAGQTISVMTLQRMKSTRSVSSHTPRSRSPLFERTDQFSEDIEQRPHSVLSYNQTGVGT
ncbi:hypothetical protein BDW59DRAFT_70785 [Aspergillus cavernicola]|uniref:Uncharacterized protein n=1 Tax=Aspergillus cavernicola TaxID=176166 RepID=A0ABR4ICV4_9EURO